MVEAIDCEIAAQRRNARRAHTVTGRKPRLASEGDGEWSYVLDTVTWPSTWTRPHALIRPDGFTAWVQAEVVPSGRTVLVRLAQQLPAGTVRAEIREDDTRTLQLLKDRLQHLPDNASPSRPTRCAVVLGDGSPDVHEEHRPERLVGQDEYGRLNPAQQSAVRRALGSDLTYIWGPPGTGKTAVLTFIVEGSMRQNRSVLFVAPTNVAVDQALLRICQRLEHDSHFQLGLVQRIGGIALPELAERYGERIDPQTTSARVTADVNARIALAQRARDHASRQLGLRRTFEALEQEKARSDVFAAQRRHEVAELEQSVTVAATRVGALETRLVRVQNSRSWRGKRLVDKEATVTAELHEARREHAARTDALSGPRALLARAEETARLTGVRLAARAADLELPQAASEQLEAEAHRTLDLVRHLEAERAQMLDTITSNVRIVATTASMAVQRRLPLDDVDTVVIDEAGMMDLPTSFYVSGLSRHRVVVAGDFRQLPAVVTATTDRTVSPEQQAHVRRWYALDPFRAGGVVTESGALAPSKRLVRLDRQYRMRPGICRIVNAIAYPDAPLVTARDDVSRLPASALLPGSAILIDTHARRIPGSSPLRNEVHAAVVRELVRGLQYDGVLPGRRHEVGVPGSTLGVIAPYVDQVTYLEKILTERFGSSFEGLAQTVHRFQGSERPLVILDTVAGAGRTVGRFFSESGLDSSTCRLLNVALSRAQDHLVVLADVAFLRDALPPHSEVRVLLDELRSRGAVVPVDELIPVRGARELAALSPPERERSAFFPADESFLAVEWDITKATRNVEVYCAFLARNSVLKWGKHLGAAVRRGVSVTVFTRPWNNEGTEAALVQHLRDQGCHVEQREAMHEKVVVVDDVLWHGSMNLLAHVRSTDLMMRVVSQSACDDVRRVLGRARPMRADRPGIPAPGDTPVTYLDVPYGEKDEAKAAGALWDRDRRRWYIDPGKTSTEAVKRWLPGT